MLSLSLPTKHQVQERREDFSASLQIDKDATEAIDLGLSTFHIQYTYEVSANCQLNVSIYIIMSPNSWRYFSLGTVAT